MEWVVGFSGGKKTWEKQVVALMETASREQPMLRWKHKNYMT